MTGSTRARALQAERLIGRLLTGITYVSVGLLVIGGQAGLNSLIGSSYPTSMRATGIGWAPD